MKKIYFNSVLKGALVIPTWLILQSGIASNAQNISYRANNKSLYDVLEVVKTQTHYEILADRKLLNSLPSITIDAKNQPLQAFLNNIFKGSAIGYRIVDKTIMLERKKPTESSNTGNAISKQTKTTLSGYIYNEDGSPAGGVTVQAKNTSEVTSTNQRGFFELKNVPTTAQISISSVNTQPIILELENNKLKLLNPKDSKGLAYNSLTTIKIYLKARVGLIEEVEVISTGYQSIKREHLTGAVSTMGTKEFENRVTTNNILDGLQNRLPGLMYNNVLQFDGENIFQIRGLSTMSKDARQPLIVLDGYPTELSIEDINPNEIESVTLLKDAASAAIYGVKSANGVLVVERKKGKLGAPALSFRSSVNIGVKTDYASQRYASNDVRKRYLMTSYDEFGEFSQDIDYFKENDDRLTPGTEPFIYLNSGLIDRATMEMQMDSIFSYNNAKDYSRYFEQTPVTQQYDLNLSGGADRMQYFLSANYTKNDLLAKNTNNNRFILSSRLVYNLSKKLEFRLTSDYIRNKSHTPDVISYNTYSPFSRIVDEQGTAVPFYSSSNYTNPFYIDVLKGKGYMDNSYIPLEEMNLHYNDYSGVTNKFLGTIRYKINRDLNLELGGIYEYRKGTNEDFRDKNSYATRNLVNLYSEYVSDTEVSNNIPKGSILVRNENHSSSLTGRIQANYNKTLNDTHTINIIAGGEIRRVTGSDTKFSYFSYDKQTLLQQPVDYQYIFGSDYWYNPDINGYTSTFKNFFDDDYTENRYISFYGNAVYAYKDKYIASGSARVDQSDLFGTDRKNRYKPFWSIGGAWNIHKENFFTDVQMINSMKLRASYGFNGNIPKTSLPQVIGKYENNGSLSPGPQTSIEIDQLANRSITWERTKTLNVGLDLTFLDRINLTLDYYRKNSDLILYEAELDPTKGGTSATLNVADMRNNGFEIRVDGDVIRRDHFQWNSAVSTTINRSKVTKVYVQRDMYSWNYLKQNYIEGYSAAPIFAYRDAGLNEKGFPMIYDKETGEKKALGFDMYEWDFTEDSKFEDLDYMGTSIPPVFIGFSNRIDYKQFYLYFMFDINTGFKTRVNRPNTYYTARPIEGSENFFVKAGDEANTDVMGFVDGIYTAEDGYLYDNSNKYVVNGSYILLRDVTLSYRLKTDLCRRIGFDNLEIKGQVSNVWTKGFNSYNYSPATGSFLVRQLKPTYTLALFANF